MGFICSQAPAQTSAVREARRHRQWWDVALRLVPSSWINSEESGTPSAGSALCSSARVLSIFPCNDRTAASGWKRRLAGILRAHRRIAVPRRWRRAQAPLWQRAPSLRGWGWCRRWPLRGGGWVSRAEISLNVHGQTQKETVPVSGSASRLVVTKLEGKSPIPLWFSPFHQFGSLRSFKNK